MDYFVAGGCPFIPKPQIKKSKTIQKKNLLNADKNNPSPWTLRAFIFFFPASGLLLLLQIHRAEIEDGEIQRRKSRQESLTGKIQRVMPWKSTGCRGCLCVLCNDLPGGREGVSPCDGSFTRHGKQRGSIRMHRAACVREAVQRAMRAVMVAGRRWCRAARAFVCARERTKWAASVLHLPPISTAMTTERHLPVPCSSGYALSFACLASCSAVPACRPARRRGCPVLVKGDTSVVSTVSCAPCGAIGYHLDAAVVQSVQGCSFPHHHVLFHFVPLANPEQGVATTLMPRIPGTSRATYENAELCFVRPPGLRQQNRNKYIC